MTSGVTQSSPSTRPTKNSICVQVSMSRRRNGATPRSDLPQVSGVSGHQAADFASQLVEIERLVEHGARSSLARVVMELRVAERGHQHDRRMKTCAAKLAEQLD